MYLIKQIIKAANIKTSELFGLSWILFISLGLTGFSSINAQTVSKATILKALSTAGYSNEITVLALEHGISIQILESLTRLAPANFSDDFIKKIITNGTTLSASQVTELIELKNNGFDESLILLTLPESPQTSTSMHKGSSAKPVVLVLDFINNTRLDNVSLGSGIADMMTTALLESGKFRVVERGETLENILAEQGLHQSGLVSSSSAATIGNILGASYVITGKVTEFGIRKESNTIGFGFGGTGKKTITARVVLDARLVSVSTAEAIAASTGIGEVATEVSTGFVLPVTMEVGTIGFDETTIGQATRQALTNVVHKISSF